MIVVATGFLFQPAYADSSPSRFTTANNTIYAPDGSVFELKGVNIFPWALNASGIVDCWGFNTVRVHSWILPRMTSPWKDHLVYVDEPLLFSEDDDTFRHYDLAPLIDIYTSQEVVVIVDIHELTGKYFEGEDLTQYIQFLEHFVDRYKNNPYVWIDLHNEPGGWDGLDGDFSSWRTESLLLMDTVRSISPEMMMIVSGTAWGQDTGPSWSGDIVAPEKSALLSNADLIQGYDNLITTFHMYDQWKFSYNRVKNYVDNLLAASDAPIFVGEYGSWNGSSTLQATQFLHTLLQEPGYEKIGRSVWTWSAWDANDLTTTGDGSGYLVDSCESPSNLTPLGELVWADNH
jgi:mannan endo-1,4-beta-mannosidase